MNNPYEFRAFKFLQRLQNEEKKPRDNISDADFHCMGCHGIQAGPKLGKVMNSIV